jgi:hypothetical protein
MQSISAVLNVTIIVVPTNGHFFCLFRNALSVKHFLSSAIFLLLSNLSRQVSYDWNEKLTGVVTSHS